MILVFGGTTEGRNAVKVMEEAGTTYYYSTRGCAQEVEMVHGRRLQGAMEAEDIMAFCREKDIRLLVDAAHPFAVNVHRNVLSVADELRIPVVRYERQYAPHTEDITWCSDYDDAVKKLCDAGVGRLLALTGVQTIGKLKDYWHDASSDRLHGCAQRECWFRILNREDSQNIARRQGFPEDHLVYYEEDGTAELIARLRPHAILTKESGKSGGFEEKISAAKAAGVSVFVVCRPDVFPLRDAPTDAFHAPRPAAFASVNGPHGLRRTIEQQLPEFFPLKTGLTTGTCATAAAKAALMALIAQSSFSHDHSSEPGSQTTVSVRIPDGEDIEVPVVSAVCNGDEATATVIKYAGDDPDVTDGLAICATVKITDKQATGNETEPETGHAADEDGAQRDERIIIKGGEGVGIVTLPGLGLPIGAPAINAVPQQMIRENLHDVLASHLSSVEKSNLSPLTSHLSPRDSHLLEVTISVPDGRETGAHTFNPRIGVVGGISIIGTSGIVRPFSSDAWISSIRKEMSVGYALTAALPAGEGPQIVINSGAKSEKFLRAHYPELPEQAFVHYGNFVGETLGIANELGVKHIAMGVMIGKAVKLAEGNLDTHSHKVTMNRDFILQMISEAGIPAEQLGAPLSSLNMARELWDILPADSLERFARVVTAHCQRHCAPLVAHSQLDVLLISEQGKIYCF
ncbi:MAG: cobalt-precorrin-5B (C(1))-methyltransferase [Prevotella sp.]|nr:cobalt-precorrin-5B (C(1))-methyltransferase [Prevotella sp.]